MQLSLNNIKITFEIAAYVCGVLFLVMKLYGGQANAGMEVSIELARAEIPSKPEIDNLSILLKLKRADIGRLELDDIAIEISDASDKTARPVIIRVPGVTTERQVRNYQVVNSLSDRGIALPPSDATQIAYLAQVKRGVPILVDATIIATRSGFWIGKPQWRASAIALPIEPQASSNKGKGGG